MKHSLVRFLTALSTVILLMLALAPAAQAAPWGVAIEAGARGAAWFEAARAWLEGVLGVPSAPTTQAKRKAVQSTAGGNKDREEPRPEADTGCGIDANGVPTPCR